jgi:hypothetical protein
MFTDNHNLAQMSRWLFLPGLKLMQLYQSFSDVARPDGEVTITIWDRAGAVGTEGEAFLGMMKIRPPRINGKMHDAWFR